MWESGLRFPHRCTPVMLADITEAMELMLVAITEARPRTPQAIKVIPRLIVAHTPLEVTRRIVAD